MWNKVSAGTKQILVLTAVVLLLRVVFIDVYQKLETTFGFMLYDFVIQITTNYKIFLPLLVADIFFVVVINKHLAYGRTPIRRLLTILCYVLVISVVITSIVNFGDIANYDGNPVFAAKLALSLLASLLINAMIVIITDVVLYYRSSRQALIREANKKRKAQYQYSQLKQQLNPHFLFNSLNILDYLIHNGDQDRASDFIRKLAGVYRYLLDTSDNRLVSLQEELRFVNMYAELLKERFTDGLDISITIPDEYMQRQIVPCGLQTLVENATKHNIVSADKPLHVRITTENNMLVTTNNLQPKINRDSSTGVGLASIRAQYRDISGDEIVVAETETEFTVKLPLL